MSKDYYKILGLDKNASADDVKKAFKKSAMQHHPDRPGGNEAKFKEINEAHQVLSDAEKRKRYDQFGSDFEQQGGFGGGMNWEDVMRQARGQGGQSQDFGFDFGDLGDLFGGGRSRSRGPARGRDIQVDVEIDFKEAAFGIEKEMSLRKQSKCDVCSGTGGEPGSKMDTCVTCGGRGQLTQTQRTFLGAIQTTVSCQDCNGVGKKPSKKCKHCDGRGVATKNSNIKVKIPAGIDNDQSIRLEGHGEAAAHGGGSGDLYVRVHVKPWKGFTRAGYDVYTEEEISYPQAVLGDTIKVETLDGELKLVVPEGTESGQLIRIKGSGTKHLERNARGDHYVKIKIRVPKKLGREVKKKLEELKKEL